MKSLTGFMTPFLTLALSLLMLSSCGKSSTEQQVDDGNTKLARMSELRLNLMIKGIRVQGVSEDTYYSNSDSSTLIRTMSRDELQAARVQLNEYIANASSVLSIYIENPDISLSNPSGVRRSMHHAQSLRDDIDRELEIKG